MGIDVYDRVVCRTPTYPLETDLRNVWDELKGYIFWSSPAFYDHIKNLDFEQLQCSSEKIQFTVWKYFNRAKFRSTPFGYFGPITTIPLARTSKMSVIRLSDSISAKVFNDWSLINEKIELHSVAFIKSNSSFYSAGGELRYLCRSGSSFQLASIEESEVARSLLLFCSAVRTIDEVRSYLVAYVDESQIDSFIQQLINLDLLVTDKHPNVIGQDYFDRLKITGQGGDKKYIISGRKFFGGSLPEDTVHVLGELFQILSSITVPEKHSDLENFKNQFLRKYEYKSVPLLEVLDPEVGIGYGGFEEVEGRDELLSNLYELNSDEQTATGHRPRYTLISSSILNKIISKEPVDLAELAVNANEEIPSKFPNIFSALVEIIDGKIILKNNGIQAGVALLGRFTLSQNDIRDMARDLAEKEQNRNPDVVFFDIGYSSEKTVDNVNRRSRIYKYELPVLVWSESGNCIDMNDVYVTVDEAEIILFSKSLGKRLIPRFATAYNFGRSELAHFRFLTDLRYNNLLTNLGIDIMQMFPNLQYYPRVTFKNVIISSAKWLIPSKLTERRLNIAGRIDRLKVWLEEIKIGEYFKCGRADQTMVFSKSSDVDLKFFVVYISNKKGLYIEECLVPTNSIIQDNRNRPYNAEFLVTFLDRERKYLPYNAHRSKYKIDSNAYLPGEKWLYYEIYCHTFRSNEILRDFLKSFLSSVENDINHWFYIRFDYPSSHLRFRMRIADSSNPFLLMQQFNDSADSWIKSKNISDIQLKTYQPEIERYGAEDIDLVEKIFCEDSNVTLGVLCETTETHALYYVALAFMESLLECSELTRFQQKEFLKTMAERHAKKQDIKSSGFKLINTSFTNFTKRKVAFSLNEALNQRISQIARMVSSLVLNREHALKLQLISDLFHMHVNRLFAADALMHEAIIYQFLYKIHLRKENFTNVASRILT